MFRIVFGGMWHGYEEIQRGQLDGEGSSELEVEDQGICVRVRAGCRDQWISHATAAKLGIALLEAAKSAAVAKSRFVFRMEPNRKGDDKAALLEGVTHIENAGPNTAIWTGDLHNGSYTRARWKFSLVKNPDLDVLTSKIEAERTVLAAAVKRILFYAKQGDADALKDAINRLYPNS